MEKIISEPVELIDQDLDEVAGGNNNNNVFVNFGDFIESNGFSELEIQVGLVNQSQG